jgi:hypothetical protein
LRDRADCFPVRLTHIAQLTVRSRRKRQSR